METCRLFLFFYKTWNILVVVQCSFHYSNKNCHGPLPAEDAASVMCWAEQEGAGIVITIELNPLTRKLI